MSMSLFLSILVLIVIATALLTAATIYCIQFMLEAMIKVIPTMQKVSMDSMKESFKEIDSDV